MHHRFAASTCLYILALAGCGSGATSVDAEIPTESPDAKMLDDGAVPLGRGQVALGPYHSCAVFPTGNVRCWGAGTGLGYGNSTTIGDDEKPSSAGDVDVGGIVTQIAAGNHHTCAVLSTGSVRCWGYSGKGQLGYGNTVSIGDDEKPSSAGDVDVGGPVTQVAAGESHTCALLASGSVRCWGESYVGQLGYGNEAFIGDDESPSSAGDVDVGGTVIQIAAGWDHTCALLDTGKVRCWGQGFDGRLGYGNTATIGDDESPSAAGDVDVGGAVSQITAGWMHTCALLVSGKVRCWGVGAYGRLGYANVTSIGDNEPPSAAGDVDVGAGVIQVAAGGLHTCARFTTGKVRCWGYSPLGQLGHGNTATIGDDETPASAGDLIVGGDVTQIAAGDSHNCVWLDNGNIRCWGRGHSGLLGYGNMEHIGDNETPSSAGDVPVL